MDRFEAAGLPVVAVFVPMDEAARARVPSVATASDGPARRGLTARAA